MDKASLLTASRVELGVSVNPRSDIIRLLGPALEIAFRFQSLISSVSLFLCLRAWFLATVTLANILYASKIVALQALIATKFGAFHSYTMSTRAADGVWNSKSIQKLRKKLFYEFAVFILGGGNCVFILVFWPGWWVIGGASWGVWMLIG
ncbi:hypothetical protein G7Z17_g12399 [Cylindrodendrum hubeiense]|uniref:Uncharacterized protein n=1 Tax=Cylindrodendrum hubeiense TaxID=595255 RepID=A0A9P5LAN6_9HYPO|nr:hypothetical protein G7Z17_g12399 [Cylindrodendrum hubeiense]